MKAGPDGSPTQPGHVHADLLSIELWVDGEKRISDPGVTSYNDDAARAWCRSSAAHNGPHFEGEDTSEVWSAFRTGRRAAARIDFLHARPTRCRASRASLDGARVSRTVELRDDGLDVFDDVERRDGQRLIVSNDLHGVSNDGFTVTAGGARHA